MKPPSVPLGFDYAKATLAITRVWSYKKTAEFCGYDSANAICKVIQGAIPSHPQGEAIYALHIELFQCPPPMSDDQRTGKIST